MKRLPTHAPLRKLVRYEKKQVASKKKNAHHNKTRRKVPTRYSSSILRPHPAPLMVLTTNLGKSLPISFRCWDRMYLDVPPATNSACNEKTGRGECFAGRFALTDDWLSFNLFHDGALSLCTNKPTPQE